MKIKINCCWKRKKNNVNRNSVLGLKIIILPEDFLIDSLIKSTKQLMISQNNIIITYPLSKGKDSKEITSFI